jgi:hypothetical protein
VQSRTFIPFKTLPILAVVACFFCIGTFAYANSFTFTVFDVPGGYGQTTATGVNDSGEIVGYFQSAGATHGFVRSSDGVTFTTIDVPGATQTYAWGINNIGELTGFFVDASGYQHGFLDDLGTSSFTIINNPYAFSGFTWTRGINDQGEIAGNIIAPSGQHAFVRSSDGANYTSVDCGTGANYATVATGINSEGQAVGYCNQFNNTPMHGFVGTNPVLFDVPGATDTFALGINDNGQTVGYSYNSPGYVGGQGFLRNADGTFTTLDVPGATGDTRATAINNNGDITGYFYDGTGAHGFLAIPASEPPALLLVILALSLLPKLLLRNS